MLPILLLLSGRAVADASLTICGLAFLLHSWKEQNWQWLRSAWVIAGLLVWPISIVFLGFFAVDSQHAIIHAIPYFRWPLFLAAMTFWLLDNEYRFKYFEWGLLAVLLFLLADGLIQFVSGTDVMGQTVWQGRLTGPFDRPRLGVTISRLALPGLAILLSLLRFSSDRVKISLYYLLLLAQLVVVFLSGDRMPFFHMFPLLLLASFILIWSLKNTRKMASAALLICLFISIGFAYQQKPQLKRFVQKTSSQIQSFASSDYGTIFNAGFDVWKKHPLTGTGIDSFTEQVGTLSIYGVPTRPTHAHSTYLESLVETGLIGLVSLLAFIALLFKKLIHNVMEQKDYLLGTFCVGSLLIIFSPVNTGTPITSNAYAALVWLVVAWAFARSTRMKAAR
ncbi:MAG: O-antigen ligase family protein [bacterium]